MSSSSSSDDDDGDYNDLIYGERDRQYHVLITTATNNRNVIYENNDKLINPGITFLSYRIPYINIHAYSVILHLAQLLAMIVCLLSLCNMGLPQTMGIWAPSVLTAYTCAYLLGMIILWIAKPNDIDHVISSASNRILSEEYIRQVRFAENDMGHYGRGFGTNLFIMIFWWAWFSLVLNYNSDINFQAWPEAYMTQMHLTTLYFVINAYLFFTYIFTNNIDSNAKIIGLRVNRKKKK